MIISRLTVVAMLALAGGGCLGEQEAKLECGAYGDAFAFGGSDYCIYTSAIIIEGFDCPAMVPFPHEVPGDGLLICGSNEAPPLEGWDELVDAWEEQGGNPGADTTQPETFQPDSFDTSLPDTGPDTVEPDVAADGAPETDPDTEVGPTDPGPCVQDLAPGQCWDASTCPAGWSCDGAAISCTPCVDCGSPIAGNPGACRPNPAADALGLVAWPAGEGLADEPVALFWIASAFYTLLECPAWTLEVADGSGGFTTGAAEAKCSGAETPESSVVIARPGASLGNASAVVVRARGRYRSSCFDQEPANCGGQVDLLSAEVTLRGAGE